MMLSLDTLKPFIEWLHANPGLAAIAVFFISCAESLALIGLFIPGTIVMPAIGSMIGAGVLPAHWIILAAILGAIGGDNLSFWLGSHFHHHIRQVWPFRHFSKLMSKGESFFLRYGWLSVFIGRFVGPVRPIIPVVAGMMRMPSNRFFVANIASAIAWAILYMAPGVLLGIISEELAPQVAARLLVILAIISFIIWFILWSTNRLWSLTHKRLEDFCSALWLNITSRWPRLGQFVHHLSLDNPKPLIIIFYIVFFIGILAIVSITANHKTPIDDIDSVLFFFLRGIQIPPLDTLMAIILFATTPIALLCLTLGPLAWFLTQREWRTSFYWCLNLVVSLALARCLQFLIPVESPSFGFHESFISPDLALFSALIGNFILLSYYRRIWVKYKKLLWIGIELVILCAALPRMYFGFNWFSGCVASIACAAITTWCCILFYYRSKTHARLMLNPALFIFALTSIVLAINSIKDTPSLLNDVLKQGFIISFPKEKWETNHTSPVPLYRVNFLGHITEALTLQYAGTLSSLSQKLTRSGWKEVPPVTLPIILNRIGAKNRDDQLPLLPDLYRAGKPALIMVKKIPEIQQMIILRLWPSQVLLQPGNIPLWVGTVKFRNAQWRWRKLSIRTTTLNDSALNILAQDLRERNQPLQLNQVVCYQRPSCYENALKIWDSGTVTNE